VLRGRPRAYGFSQIGWACVFGHLLNSKKLPFDSKPTPYPAPEPCAFAPGAREVEELRGPGTGALFSRGVGGSVHGSHFCGPGWTMGAVGRSGGGGWWGIFRLALFVVLHVDRLVVGAGDDAAGIDGAELEAGVGIGEGADVGEQEQDCSINYCAAMQCCADYYDYRDKLAARYSNTFFGSSSSAFNSESVCVSQELV